MALSSVLFATKLCWAVTETWNDPSGTDVSWELGDQNWATQSVANPPGVSWQASLINPGTAVFGGTYGSSAETVYLEYSPLYVSNLIFQSSDFILAGDYPLTLTSSLSISLANASYAQLQTPISGAFNVGISGNGIAEFDVANTYSGSTIVNGGVLRLAISGALPGGNGTAGGTSNLTFNGGILDLAAGDNFTRSLGSSSSQVQFLGSGGFSASFGSTEIVNLGGASAQVTWGSGSFVPTGGSLMLGSIWDDSMVDFQNPINLGSATRTILVTSGTSLQTPIDGQLSGALIGSGTAGLTFTGNGNIQLTASNSYPGQTTVSGVTLWLANSAALPGGILNTATLGNLNITSGIIALAATNGSYLFSRSLGTLSGQVQITGSGGFSAVSNNWAVNLGGGSAALTWGSATFLPGTSALILGSTGDSAMVDFQNPINLGTTTRNVIAEHGSAVLDAQLSGVLSGTGGINFSGGGYINLTASNSYSGATTVVGGTVLRISNTAALSSASNLNLNGGIIELGVGNFTRSLGTAAGQVQFTGSGGFSAANGNWLVNLGGGSAGVTWGTSSFVPSGQPFVLGSSSDYGTVNFQNPINLNGAARTIFVNQGLNQAQGTPDAEVSGAISGVGTASSLTISGGGALILAGSNSYQGTTTLAGGGVLRLTNTAALPGGIGASGGLANLVLSNGVLELALSSGTFSRGVGPGATQVSFGTLAGFSAGAGNQYVNLGGNASPSTLTWGSNFFVSGGTLEIGSVVDNGAVNGVASYNAALDFMNPMNTGSGTIAIQVNSGTAFIDAQLTGALSGVGGFSMQGNGVLELTASNSYSGATNLAGGVLRLSNSAALPGGISASASNSSTAGNLNLSGGILELNNGNFTRSLGTGQGQVQWTNAGGFSAAGANRIVNLGGGSAGVTWGVNGFVPLGADLLLGSQSDTAMVDFQNPINLAGAQETIDISTALATIDARLSGALTGTGTSGITFIGPGTVELTGNNSYSGTTSLSGGVVRLSNTASLPGGTGASGGLSNLQFNGGVLELNAGNFYYGLGTGAGKVQFAAAGGFSAAGANRIVNLGGGTATVTWGTNNFVPAGQSLLFGSPTDSATLIFQNPISLGSNTGSIAVTAGSATIDADITGTISGSGGLVLSGNGVLQLAGSNSYSGGTVVSGGILRLANAAALPGGTGATGALGNLSIAGGLIDLDASDFKLPLGTGSGQVQLSGIAGFSASGGTRNVNFGGSSAQIAWGTGTFLNGGGTLTVGSTVADGTVAMQNPINLAQPTANIDLLGGSNTIDGQFTGVLSGSGGIYFYGTGAVEFTASNSYTGSTTLAGGSILRLSNSAALPNASNLIFNGGEIELNAANFTRNLGTSAGQVQFQGSGGFSAYNASGTGSRIVAIGGGTASVAWGANNFVPVGQSLILGAPTSNVTVNFQNPISLSNSASIEVLDGSAGVDAQLTGVISGTSALAISGNGVLELTATNTYTGATLLNGGVLRLSSSYALPGGIGTSGGSSNLVLGGGVLELNANSFTRGLGTAAGQVQFSGSGGFSAYNIAGTGTRVVNLGGSSATVSWGTAGFVPAGQSLVLGSPSDNVTVDFQNAVSTSGATAMVDVLNGSATVDARLSGAITGTGGLTLSGSGTLELTNTNTYTGPTTLGGGVLRLSSSNALPGGIGTTGGSSNLVLGGGVVELNTNNFTRGLGTLASQVQFTTGGGGFSASGGTRSVNLGGNGAAVTWGSGSFVPLGQPFLFGSQSEGATLNFLNPIVVPTGTQSIEVTSGTSSAADAQLSGAITGTGGLIVSGDGTLQLTATNTFSGGLSVSSGEVILVGAKSLLSGSSLVIGSTASSTSFSSLAEGTPVSAPSSQASTVVSPAPEPATWTLLIAAAGLWALRSAFMPSWKRPK